MVHYYRRQVLGLLISAIAPAAGCTTFTSTLLESNCGHPGCHKKTHLKGYPITLKVPTHLEVKLTEEFYLKVTTDGKILDPVKCDGKLLRTYNVATHVIRTDKIFTVDYKRPVAGKIEHNTAFTKDQYVAEIHNRLVDNTILQVGTAVQRFLYNLGTGKALPQTQVAGNLNRGLADWFPADTGFSGSAGANVVRTFEDDAVFKSGSDASEIPGTIKHSRVVAMEVFSLDDPGCADQITAFLQQHTLEN